MYIFHELGHSGPGAVRHRDTGAKPVGAKPVGALGRMTPPNLDLFLLFSLRNTGALFCAAVSRPGLRTECPISTLGFA